MTPMTAQDLVTAVTQLTSPPDHPIATGDEIKGWCAAHSIDWGQGMPWTGRHFEDADHANAPSVLRKFKITPISQNGANGWCLVDNWTSACAWTAVQTPRWYAIPWSASEKNWMWQQSVPVDATTQLATFDLP